MILTPTQIEELLAILDRQFFIFTAAHLGPDYLTDQEKKNLSVSGIDYNKLYQTSRDPVALNFHLGILSNIIGDKKAKGLSFKDLKDYIESGHHIELNEVEKKVLHSVKSQSLADIKTMKGRIFNDVNQLISQNNIKQRSAYEKIVRDHVYEGMKNRESVKEITRSLAKKTGDWSRDFTKMVEYISHTALNEGRAQIYQRRYGSGKKAKVYFEVQAGACKHCIECYLTDGFGSQPKIFTLDELRENGTNIGRKAAEWLPTIGPIHPHCRCLMCEFHDGMQWDGKSFVVPKKAEYTPTINRPKVRIVYQGKEYFV